MNKWLPIVIWFVLCAIYWYSMYRIDTISIMHSKLLVSIDHAIREDRDNGLRVSVSWRYDEMEKVSFYRKLFSFWKPVKVESFYKDIAFTQPTVIPDFMKEAVALEF